MSSPWDRNDKSTWGTWSGPTPSSTYQPVVETYMGPDRITTVIGNIVVPSINVEISKPSDNEVCWQGVKDNAAYIAGAATAGAATCAYQGPLGAAACAVAFGGLAAGTACQSAILASEKKQGEEKK